MELEIQNQSQKQLNVQVAIRARPLNSKEQQQKEGICLNTTVTSVHLTQSARTFTFDQVFDIEAPQEAIFHKCVSQLVMRCFEGYNSTLLAYGQTGSGKTYTMGTSGVDDLDDSQLGVIPRVVYYVFNEIEKRKLDQEILIGCSYLELYNEQIIDLLDETPLQEKCQPTIREEKDHTISILNLTTVSVNTPQEMLQVLHRGGTHRTTAATLMNMNSSRSHAIFTIYFKINPREESDIGALTAKFHFVDLAGSERLKKTQAIGKAMEEGININQSLLVLGNVIKTLSERKKNVQSHIPYRESKLTRILQDSLGGNSNTYMIACISPAESNYEETLNTLKYASRAREIQNKPTQNRDPHAAQIMALKQNITELQGCIQQYQQVLKDNNIDTQDIKIIAVQADGINCEEHQEIIKNLRNNQFIVEKQLQQCKMDVQSLSKALSESEIQSYTIKRQRDQNSKQLQDAKRLLLKNNITLPTGEEVSVYESYNQEINILKMQLQDRDQRLAAMQYDFDKLIKDSHRDQKILCQKQKQLMSWQEKYERMRQQCNELGDDYNEQDDMEFDDYEICQADQEIEEYESNIQDMTDRNTELKKQLAEDMKKEYFMQISILEQQKAQLLKQVTTKQDVGQVNQLKTKVSELESKIQDMRIKENTQKQLQKKIEESENVVRDLKGNIEKIKRQKVDLIRKMKDENEKFIKFKDERYKELLLARKSKIQQEQQVRKLKNENIKKDLTIKRKDDEILKQKGDKIFNRQTHKPSNKLLEYDQFIKLVNNVFEELVEGEQSEIQLEKEQLKISELQDELMALDQKYCQLQVRKEQIIYDIQHNPQLIDQLNQIELILSNTLIDRESLNETLEFQIHKIDQLRGFVNKANQYYQVFLSNQYFKELPNWLSKSMKYVVDNWVSEYTKCKEINQQYDELLYTYNDLQKENVRMVENSSPTIKKKILKPIQPCDQNDLRKQLNDQRRKYQSLQNENKQILMDLDYYKKFYQQCINKTQKDKKIGVNKSENHYDMQTMQQNYFQSRENFKLEKQKSKDMTQFSQHSRTIGGSDLKLTKAKSSNERFSEKEQWISDQVNLSQEVLDVKYDLIKQISAHDTSILHVYSWENMLYTTAFKSVRIWDIEAQQQISALDQLGYVRSVCHWPERNAFAVSCGSLISLYDQSSLMCIGNLRSTAEDIKVLIKHNGMLVAAGKGNNNAMTVFDARSNNVLFEFEKGMDILSIAQSDINQELYWGTLNHNVKHMQLNSKSAGSISSMVPPHYDKVTGVGLVDSWVVSCSFGKAMRMWNQYTGVQGKDNSDIHKDSINCMAIDQQLKLMYTGSKDGQLKAIKINDNKFQLLSDITASSQPINSIAVINSNSCLVSGGVDKTIKIWKPTKHTYETLRQNAQNVADFQIEEEQ